MWNHFNLLLKGYSSFHQSYSDSSAHIEEAREALFTNVIKCTSCAAYSISVQGILLLWSAALFWGQRVAHWEIKQVGSLMLITSLYAPCSLCREDFGRLGTTKQSKATQKINICRYRKWKYSYMLKFTISSPTQQFSSRPASFMQCWHRHLFAPKKSEYKPQSELLNCWNILLV